MTTADDYDITIDGTTYRIPAYVLYDIARELVEQGRPNPLLRKFLATRDSQILPVALKDHTDMIQAYIYEKNQKNVPAGPGTRPDS